nr:PREDICTED: immunoglobulin superfamily member 1-like [Latimeria chalumnae]|eukprot:XP_014349443.1 PREDICTED: immunoglobulin superfamily member 1-like [Latimeria chalumnae]
MSLPNSMAVRDQQSVSEISICDWTETSTYRPASIETADQQVRHGSSITLLPLSSENSDSATDQLRLVNGSGRCAGRVEVYHNGEWGTVCHDDWNLDDGDVVCRQLECGSAISTPESAVFGEGSGVIWLDEVQCTAAAHSLSSCRANSWGDNNCIHEQDAGVVCSESMSKPIAELETTHTVFETGEDLLLGCSGPMLYVTQAFHFYKDDGEMPISSTDAMFALNNAFLSLRNLNTSNEGTYRCRYEVWVSESTLFSPYSDSIHVSIVDLSKPAMTLQAPYTVFEEGENVTLVCTGPAMSHNKQFQLYKDEDELFLPKRASAYDNSTVFMLHDVKTSSGGNYFCQYKEEIFGRVFWSPQSDPTKIVVVEMVKSVAALQSPYTALMEGESFTLVCSGPRMDMKKWFGLYRGNQGQPLLTKRVPMDDNSTAFVVHDVRLSRERNYSCRYEVEVLGRVLQSPQSDPIQILVVSIPVPTIMMTPSNGIVQNRNSLRIKCSASVSYPYTSMVFFLKKVPNNIDFQMTPTNNSFVIFTVANVNLTYAGNYTCGYQTFILDRTFTSLDSDLVQVVITEVSLAGSGLGCQLRRTGSRNSQKQRSLEVPSQKKGRNPHRVTRRKPLQLVWTPWTAALTTRRNPARSILGSSLKTSKWQMLNFDSTSESASWKGFASFASGFSPLLPPPFLACLGPPRW